MLDTAGAAVCVAVLGAEPNSPAWASANHFLPASMSLSIAANLVLFFSANAHIVVMNCSAASFGFPIA